MKRTHLHALATLAALGLAAPAYAQSYTITVTDLTPTNLSGYASSTVYAAAGSTQVGTGRGSATGNNTHALLWNGSADSAVDLNPSGFTSSTAFGASGSAQVGFGSGSATGQAGHALLWSGSAGSVVDLNPAHLQPANFNYGDYESFGYSQANAASGNTQVGYGTSIDTVQGGNDAFSSDTHALLWNGSASSAIDLNPDGYSFTLARGVSGNTQVGDGLDPTSNTMHALLWQGYANSMVDLNPSGFNYSHAYAASGNTQVGYGSTQPAGGAYHALLWNGTAGSAVDLNPDGYLFSEVYGVSGNLQVGFGGVSGSGHTDALLWTGTAGSAIDLGASLPAGYNAVSEAVGVDSNGDIVGYGQGSSGVHAFVWHLAANANTPVGVLQDKPVQPAATSQTPAGAPTYTFATCPNGSWIDPTPANGFTFTMKGNSKFTNITGFPKGFSSPFDVFVGGVKVGSFRPGDALTFAGGGVSSFTISGINPTVDGSDPNAFPLQVTYDTPTADFTLTALAAAPEPSAYAGLALGALGLAGLALRARRRVPQG